MIFSQGVQSACACAAVRARARSRAAARGQDAPAALSTEPSRSEAGGRRLVGARAVSPVDTVVVVESAPSPLAQDLFTS